MLYAHSVVSGHQGVNKGIIQLIYTQHKDLWVVCSLGIITWSI